MNRLATYLPPLGRLLMSIIFITSGYRKLMNSAATAKYMAGVGIPSPDLAVWAAIAIELLGGIAILIGFKTRWTAFVLAGWCLVTGLAVHLVTAMNATDIAVVSNNMIHVYKNIAIAGGFLYIMAYGAGALSVDNDARRT